MCLLSMSIREPFAERDLLVGCEILIAQEQDVVLHEGSANLGNRSCGQIRC